MSDLEEAELWLSRVGHDGDVIETELARLRARVKKLEKTHARIRHTLATSKTRSDHLLAHIREIENNALGITDDDTTILYGTEASCEAAAKWLGEQRARIEELEPERDMLQSRVDDLDKFIEIMHLEHDIATWDELHATISTQEARIEELEGVWRCEHCGSDKMYSGPPDCPDCGAPNCCQTCCKITTLELRRDEIIKAVKNLKGSLSYQGHGASAEQVLARVLLLLEKKDG